MDGPGTVTWEEFLENAERFLAVSNEISDGWELRGDKDTPGQAYLVRTAKCFVPSDYIAGNGGSIGNNDDENIEEFYAELREDPYEAPSFACEVPFISEHHVLWSLSYGVPLLFFNGWKSDFPGINPVSVNEAQTIHASNLSYMELSQAIHPIIGVPFLQLHPCLSQELLRSMSRRMPKLRFTENVVEYYSWSYKCCSKNKLVSWLSCVAPAALNLKIHPNYYRLTY